MRPAEKSTHTSRQRPHRRRDRLARLRIWERVASLTAILILLTGVVAPAVAQLLQPADSGLSICRVVPADDAPAAPADTSLPCLCPGVCAASGYAFAPVATDAPAELPVPRSTRYLPTTSDIRITRTDALRPWLRGPPDNT